MCALRYQTRRRVRVASPQVALGSFRRDTPTPVYSSVLMSTMAGPRLVLRRCRSSGGFRARWGVGLALNPDVQFGAEVSEDRLEVGVVGVL